MNKDSLKIFVASKVAGVGRKTIKKLVKDYNFLDSSFEEWSKEYSPFKKFIPGSDYFKSIFDDVDEELNYANKCQDRILTFLDDDYPSAMRDLDDGAAVVYARGDIKALNKKSVAIIGTREPTKYGEIIATRLTGYFSERGWCVVSGLAKGIDTIAHRTALEVGGRTVAVLSGSLDDIYPKENNALAQKIIQSNGVLISEYSYKSKNFRVNFVERDRIQAAISAGVIMIQSDVQGGSWHASRASLKFGRPLAVIYPVAQDIFPLQDKVKGNLELFNSDNNERAKFLKTEIHNLSNLVFIKSRENYLAFEDRLHKEALNFRWS